MLEPDLELDALAHAVIGAALEVHRQLGPGYLESVYEEALGIELGLRAIPFDRQLPIAVRYKGQAVGEGRLDFLIDELLIVELKAVDDLAPIHKAQVISYLKATNLHLGLLINFNMPVLKDGIQRISSRVSEPHSRSFPKVMPHTDELASCPPARLQGSDTGEA